MQMAAKLSSKDLTNYGSVAKALNHTFLGLPDDIFLQICCWLAVGDILALRLVTKAICPHTKNSSLWLSFLRRLTLALPPGQPLLPDLSGYYALNTLESFVSRALKLEQSWRDYNPLPSHYRFNGHNRILSMRNLPGGKHMVSVSQDLVSRMEFLVVWDMNYRGRRNHVAIAMFNSETPVHKLHVRYAMVNGQASLLIALTRPPSDGKTLINVTSISLEVLDNLSALGPGTRAFEEYGKLVPNSFTNILETRTRYPVGALSLSEIGGNPVLAVVQRPRTIAFYFLDSDIRACLKLTPVPGYDHWRHSIWDVKILSSQNQILVIRVLIGDVNAMNTIPLVFETYDIPPSGVEDEEPVPHERKLISDYRIDGFYVSDAEASWWFKNHRDPHIPMLHEIAHSPPPPISIFVTTKAPRGFLHYLMLPEAIHPPSNTLSTKAPKCIYKLPTGTHAQCEWDEDEQAAIIPGAYRSIIWMRSSFPQPPQGIKVRRLAVYRTEGYAFSDSRDTGHVSGKQETQPAGHMLVDVDPQSMDLDEAEYLQNNLHGMPVESPKHRAMKYPVVPEEVAQAMRNATQSIQFDEWLGRLCVATAQDTWIQVLDWSL